MRIKTNLRVVAGPLELTPLVDVVFLLLIFFMISSSLVFWPGTKVDTEVELPPARTNSMTAADKLIITITRAGLLFFNDKPVQWEGRGDQLGLEGQLRLLVSSSQRVSGRRGGGSGGSGSAARRPPLVVLRADQSIEYGKIVQVMSLARSLGLGVYLVTDPEKAEPNRIRSTELE